MDQSEQDEAVSDTVSDASFDHEDDSAIIESAVLHSSSTSSEVEDEEDDYVPSGKGKKCSPVLRISKRPIEIRIKRQSNQFKQIQHDKTKRRSPKKMIPCVLK